MRTLGPRVKPRDHRTVRPMAKRADPELLSPEWKALRARIVAERDARCEVCGRSDGQLYLDHVIERRDGGPALPDRGGVRLMCGSCHTRKTVAVRARRAGLTVR